MTTKSVIEVEHLFKDYETDAGVVHILKDVNLKIEQGELVAIMGPSGSGKSTFMNILGCLDIPTAGHYFLNGENSAHLNDDELAHLRNEVIGFVFQGFNLLPRANIANNIALPLVYRGVGVSTRLQRASEMLAKVGLAGYEKLFPNQLSGGQQQRIAIARALANHPRLILADEPTGNLDTATSKEIMTLFEKLNKEDGITVVFVTHEKDIAMYANRLIRFVDGRITHDGEVSHIEAVHA